MPLLDCFVVTSDVASAVMLHFLNNGLVQHFHGVVLRLQLAWLCSGSTCMHSLLSFVFVL